MANIAEAYKMFDFNNSTSVLFNNGNVSIPTIGFAKSVKLNKISIVSEKDYTFSLLGKNSRDESTTVVASKLHVIADKSKVQEFSIPDYNGFRYYSFWTPDEKSCYVSEMKLYVEE